MAGRECNSRYATEADHGPGPFETGPRRLERPPERPHYRADPLTEPSMKQFDGTTILCVRRGSQVALGGDGQVSMEIGRAHV